ncbi:hypothetical protein M0R45_005069 [Rubus argutus]|uniref:Uncharacterized protein n=1 Tax=Rubus argutus TaxID=59490 RepID=A0AAW1YM37_RUBAR
MVVSVVICESEHLRQAYNDAFAHFNFRCSSQPLKWAPNFYDQLQNQIVGGKPKMRWYFKEHGWPSSTIFEKPPEDDGGRAKIIDNLQLEDFAAYLGIQLTPVTALRLQWLSFPETRYLSKGLFGRGGQCYWASGSNKSWDIMYPISIYPDLSNIRLKDLELLLQNVVIAN